MQVPWEGLDSPPSLGGWENEALLACEAAREVGGKKVDVAPTPAKRAQPGSQLHLVSVPDTLSRAPPAPLGSHRDLGRAPLREPGALHLSHPLR